MKKYRFIGDPKGYTWIKNPVFGDVYDVKKYSECRGGEDSEYVFNHCVPNLPFEWELIPEPVLGEWISVDDRLPDYDEYVLWYRSDGYVFVEGLDKDEDWDTFNDFSGLSWLGDNIEITHWQPLPEPPKK